MRNKMFKSLSMLLSGIVVFSTVSPVLADTTETITYEEGVTATDEFQQNVEFSASKGSTFTVSLPKEVMLESNTAYDIKAGIYADIAADQKLVIEPVDNNLDTVDVIDFTLENIVPVGFMAKDDITVEVTSTKSEWLYNDTDFCDTLDGIALEENQVVICQVPEQKIPAGEWSGKLPLRISLKSVNDAGDGLGEYTAFTLRADNWEQTGLDTRSGDVTIPKTFEYDDVKYKVTTIGESAFDGVTDLTSVVIPSSVTTIESGAFNECSGLTAVVIPNSVTEVDSWAFNECSNLESVTLSNSMTILTEGMFSNCVKLNNVVIPGNITTIEKYVFDGCTTLSNIMIPTSVTSIGARAFKDTAWLAEKQGENPLVVVNNMLIDAATATGSVQITDGITVIGDKAFKNNVNVTDITIPATVTIIGEEALFGCTGLTELTVPDTVTFIGENAFSEVPHVTYNGSYTEGSPWGATAIN